MANVTGNDSENPFDLSREDLQFLDNLVGSSQPEPSPNEAQKESNYDYFLPTPPDNSNNGTLNASIYCQHENKSYNALDLCLPTPSDYFDFGTSSGFSIVEEKSANQCDKDTYNCYGDRPYPSGIN